MSNEKRRRWHRHSTESNHTTVNNEASVVESLDQQAQSLEQKAACLEAPVPRRGHRNEDGTAYFPVMSEDEVAVISVPASAPADQMRSTLSEHGVCLVTGVLDEKECHRFESLWSADLAALLGSSKTEANKSAALQFRKEGVRTWPDKWSSILGKKGMASQRGLPHGEFAWESRLHSGVRKTFADVFETSTDSLAVGLDCVFWSGADAPAADSNVEWLHCDQNHRTGLTWPCVQGVLYVWSSEGEKASTTVVWPGSHQGVYDEIMQDGTAIKHGRSMSGQSVKLSQLSSSHLRQKLMDAAMASCRRVPCPAGSLLLWDSRTIHQGWRGGPRLAQPICWEPRERREGDPNALGRKVFMCTAGIPSSHSSAEARVHGMAPRSRHTEFMEGEEMPAIRKQIVPYCVATREKQKWEKVQQSLWRRGAIDEADSEVLAALLKLEILNVL